MKVLYSVILFCLCSLLRIYGQENYTIVFQDDFSNCVTQKMGASSVQILEKRGFDAVQIGKKLQASMWTVDWNTLTQNCDFGMDNGKFYVSAPQNLRLLGEFFSPVSQKYQMEFTLTALESNSGNATISVGVYDYGLYAEGPRVLEKITIEKGKTKTFSVSIPLDYDFAPFRPMLDVSGNVRFDKCVIKADSAQIKREQRTLIEGTLTGISAIPDPKKSDYPNCRFTAHFVGNSIVGGMVSPKEVNLVIEGFQNYKLLKTSTLRVNDKVRVLMLPFDKLDTEEKSTQQADDLNLFYLENYYCIGIQKINDFHDSGEFPESGIYFNDAKIKYVSVFERHVNPPIPQNLADAQKKSIAEDLAEINRMLEPYTDAKKKELNSAFKAAWEKEKNKDAQTGKNRLVRDNRTYVWRNVDNSFWCLPETYTFTGNYAPVSEDKIAAMVALKDFLEANGCQFIVSLVPNLHHISARIMNPDFRDIPDFYTACVAKQLLEAGIETVFASADVVRNYNRYPFAFFYPHDWHPSDTTQDVLTDLLAEKLKRYEFKPNLNESSLAIDLFQFVYKDNEGYLFPSDCDIGNNKASTPYKCRRVLYDGKPLQYDKESQILVFGNSFIRAPMDYPDSMPTLLAYKLKYGVNSFRISGNGPMTVMVQNMFANPEKLLKDLKVVVLQFGTNHLYQPTPFNNIRYMDNQIVVIAGKRNLHTLNVPGEQSSNIYKSAKDVNAVKVKENKSRIMDEISVEQCHWDPGKEMAVCVNAWLLDGQKVEILVNGKKVNIPVFSEASYGKYFPAAVLLPPGTDRIAIEASGVAGNEILIKNIQIFQ